MSATVIPPDKMAVYRATARRRQRERRRAIAARFERATARAIAVAQMLQAEFDAQQVAQFGSLVHPQLFHERSDIDLAVWGVDERRYLRAVGRALDIAGPEFLVDLVRMEEAGDSLRAVIEEEAETLL